MTVDNATSRRVTRKTWLLAAIAAGALLASITLYWDFFATNLGPLWTHTDEWIYRAAGVLVRHHPADLYTARLGEPRRAHLPFTYPPFAALVFAAFSWLSFSIWQVGIVAADVVLVPVIVFVALRISGHRGWRAVVPALGLGAIALWLEPVYSTLYFGQINLILLALIMIDFALPDSCRWKGAATGLAAALKLTPLIFVPYLLATRRIRPAIVSLGTFAASVAIGFAVLPTASAQFWTSLSPSGAGGTQKIVDQSVNGMVQRLLQQSPDAKVVWAVLAVVVATAGVAVAAVASRRGLELPGVVLCGVTGVLVSPVSWTHHWVWAVPALALLAVGRAGPDGPRVPRRDRAARLAGTALLLGVFFAWPARALRWHGRIELFPLGLLRHAAHGQVGTTAWLEYTWRGATWMLGNSYVLAGLLAIAGAGSYLWATRGGPRRGAVGVPAPRQERPTMTATGVAGAADVSGGAS